ncbi:unnamed protein product [Spodoptera exigua]|nr:unnamed protein product [Spodoptera exigua]
MKLAKEVTRAKTDGKLIWQPKADPNEVIPIKTFCPFWVATRGPPESPLQVPTPPTPLVQRLEAWRTKGKAKLQALLAMTFRRTWLRTWLALMLPPLLVKPKPDAMADAPTKSEDPLARAMGAMLADN